MQSPLTDSSTRRVSITFYTMPALSFTDRASENGIYHSIVPKIKEDKRSLTIISPADDLIHVTSLPWGNNNFTTRFRYHNSKDEAVVHLFGETLGLTDGTSLGALGGTTVQPGNVFFLIIWFTWFNRDKTQIVDEKTTIRDVIVLDVPTVATKELENLYMDQVATLNTIYVQNLHFVCNLLSPTAPRPNPIL